MHLSRIGPEKSPRFFPARFDAAGSFGGIYQSAVLAYGSELIKNPVDADRFVDLQHLHALESAGGFAGQQIAIQPIRSGGAGPLEDAPLLSKNIRFLFEPNSSRLRRKQSGEFEESRGHSPASADQSRLARFCSGDMSIIPKVADFRKQGGECFLSADMALQRNAAE